MRDLSDTAPDPALRIQRFISMPDADLDQILKVQSILEGKAKGSRGPGGGVSAAVWGMMASLGSLAGGFASTSTPTPAASHPPRQSFDHDHSHVHGPNCSHGHAAPDITKGGAATMDR